MLKLIDLVFDFGGDAGIGMSNRDGHDAAKKIQILLAFNIPQVLHGGMVGDQGIFVINGDGRKKVLQRSDRKSTRLNSSHQIISYAVFCLKKKKKKIHDTRQQPQAQEKVMK